MRWLPKRRSTRAVILGMAGLLALGGIVGAATLDSGGGGSDGSGVRSASGVSGTTVVGAGGGSATAFAPDDMVAEAHSAPVPGIATSGGGSAGGSGGGGAAMSVPVEALPGAETGRVVKSAAISVEVAEKAFGAAREKVVAFVGSLGGFVQSSVVEDDRSTMTVRVPGDDFEVAMNRLRDLGEVSEESISGEDVTEEFVDLDARLRHWRAQEAIFLDLMTRATTVTETIEVQRQLSIVQQNIEQLEGRKRFLENRTDFATITVTVTTPAAVAPAPDGDARPSLSEAWAKAWDAGVEVVGGTLIVLGALVPLTLILGIPGGLLWSVLRRRRGPAVPAPSPAA